MISQSNVEGVSATEFEVLEKQLSYDKTKRAIKPREYLDKKKKDEDKIKSPSMGLGLFSGLANILAYIVIGVLLVVVVYVIFSNVQIQKKIKSVDISIDHDIENQHIEEIDVESEYDLALKNGDYRLALRFQFIKALQKLSSAKKIDWKAEKTNRDYARELRGTDYFFGFQSLSSTFEWVWYGDRPINEQEFNRFNEKFNEFYKLS